MATSNHHVDGGQRIQNSHAFAESFRNLRSHLICTAGLPPGPRILMVTSSIPKEGKTTISANLGMALAMAGERVLLIDADLRRSSLHKVFHLRDRPGLSEVLARTVSASDAVALTMTPNLFLLPAGDAKDPGSELFLKQPVEPLLRELTSRFTYILIDTAPVLATDDAGTLGARTHGAFMVVRAGYTSARMIRESLERLRKRKVHLLGLIYNRAGRSSDYYSKYTREYYAGVPEAQAALDEQPKAT